MKNPTNKWDFFFFFTRHLEFHFTALMHFLFISLCAHLLLKRQRWARGLPSTEAECLDQLSVSHTASWRHCASFFLSAEDASIARRRRVARLLQAEKRAWVTVGSSPGVGGTPGSGLEPPVCCVEGWARPREREVGERSCQMSHCGVRCCFAGSMRHRGSEKEMLVGCSPFFR